MINKLGPVELYQLIYLSHQPHIRSIGLHTNMSLLILMLSVHYYQSQLILP